VVMVMSGHAPIEHRRGTGWRKSVKATLRDLDSHKVAFTDKRSRHAEGMPKGPLPSPVVAAAEKAPSSGQSRSEYRSARRVAQRATRVQRR
jgi:hypothetical protein